MIVALSKKIDVSVVHLTKTFGMYLFAELIAAYPQWIDGLTPLCPAAKGGWLYSR